MEKYEPEKVDGWRVLGLVFDRLEDAKARAALLELRDIISMEESGSSYELAELLVRNAEKVRLLLSVAAAGNPNAKK